MNLDRWNDPTTTGLIRIKICGLCEAADIEAAKLAGADAIGLVLAEGSPRRVTDSLAKTLASLVSNRMTTISLMVNPSAGDVRNRCTPWIQLHGQEDANCVALAAETGPVIRAVAFDDTDAIRQWDADPHVARILIDGHRGGSGVRFDHDAFAEVAATIKTPWILAGGLDPDHVAKAIHALHPWGVDVSSGVESVRGIKDPARITAFCEAVHAAS
jgi:phosphoribosylanthranilate isomerase